MFKSPWAHLILDTYFTSFLIRCSDGTKPVGKGTGLGLSISKSILEAHRGLLKIDKSAPNTRFVIGLPKAQADTYYKAAA